MLKTIPPSSPVLKEHIECFYMYSVDSDSKLTYLAFPHCNTGLSFFKGVVIQRNYPHIILSESVSKKISMELLGKYNSPLLIDYTGPLQELSIIFKPLGINRFFRQNYQSIAPHFSQELINESWSNFGEQLTFTEADLPDLESFLLSQYEATPELIPIQKALSLLNDSNEKRAIVEIANELGFNLKTFQRYFNKHIGCSPIEYRRICRFRNSLTSKFNNSELKNFTDITYEEGYFDQSYLIKEFRKLTGHNPKEFFKATSKVDGDKIIWEIK